MIVQSSELVKILARLKEESKKIVFTNGCFDIIHAGHVIYLEKARSLGDCLVIGLNSDDSVRRLKGNKRPVNCSDDRAKVLDSLKFVDFVTVFDEDTPHELIKLLQPDILVKGGDYRLNEIVGSDLVIRNGGIVTTIPYVEGKSTTSILKKIISLG